MLQVTSNVPPMMPFTQQPQTPHKTLRLTQMALGLPECDQHNLSIISDNVVNVTRLELTRQRYLLAVDQNTQDSNTDTEKRCYVKPRMKTAMLRYIGQLNLPSVQVQFGLLKNRPQHATSASRRWSADETETLLFNAWEGPNTLYVRSTHTISVGAKYMTRKHFNDFAVIILYVIMPQSHSIRKGLTRQ